MSFFCSGGQGGGGGGGAQDYLSLAKGSEILGHLKNFDCMTHENLM